jgi:hypothetical protein
VVNTLAASLSRGCEEDDIKELVEWGDDSPTSEEAFGRREEESDRKEEISHESYCLGASWTS